MSGHLLLRSVMLEITSRTIEIFLCSVTPDELMKGKILDCVIDLRKNSKTFGKNSKLFSQIKIV